MNKLHQNGNNYFIQNYKEFTTGNFFKSETIDRVFDFAYEMTFGNGEHRDHRTGGYIKRKKGQIFINTFQGKLSELAIYIEFFKFNRKAYDKLSEPDFEVYGLGEWDDSDIMLDNIKFSIKSTKFYGNLLLLETKDWSDKGEYLPNVRASKNAIYDYFVLVRIKPDAEKLMISERYLYSNEINREGLYSLIKGVNWEYDVPGYITNDDLKLIISSGHIIPQGAMLNSKIKMDAENYYIQAFDMKDFKKMIASI